MAKIHDLFIIELAEVIKGYGNDPDVEDPFRLSEFYRFYELPNIAVSRENFEKMRPAQPEQRWIPCSERLPEKNCRCLTTNTAWGSFEVDFNVWINGEWLYPNEKPIAWMPLPKGYQTKILAKNLKKVSE